MSKARVTFLPITPIKEGRPIEYKIVILDKSDAFLNQFFDTGRAPGTPVKGASIQVKDLDGLTLTFRGDGRPHPKYVLFHFMGATGVQAAMLEGGEVDSCIEKKRDSFKSPKLTLRCRKPEEWYNKSILRLMAEYHAFDVKAKAMLFPMFGDVAEAPIGTKTRRRSKWLYKWQLHFRLVCPPRT